MSAGRALVIAADPLLRKTVAEVAETLASLDSATALTPTRATAERVAGADYIIVAGRDGDAAALRSTVAAALAAGRALVFVVVGRGDAPSALSGLVGGTAVEVAIPELNIRDELARAAPRLDAALQRAQREAETRPSGTAVMAPATVEAARPAPVRPAVPSAPYLGVVVCIGASTGGTDALLTILSRTPRTTAPIVIVQHMPGAYVGDFARRLDQSCTIDVSLAQDDLPLRPGLAVVAPGGRQLRLLKDAKGIWTRSGEASRVGGHSPAADVLMESAALQLGKRAIGVVLTGMGRDGADGLLAMRGAGARTIAQDEVSSVVYGMPKAAAENGAADSVVPLTRIADFISGVVMSMR